MKTEEIKTLVQKYNDPKYFEFDPISIVKRYTDPRDIEIAAVICSTLAFGNRQQIYKACDKTMALMGRSPYKWLMCQSWLMWQGDTRCWYRMLKYNDLAGICYLLKMVYTNFETLEDCIIQSMSNIGVFDTYNEVLSNIFYGCKGIPKDNKSCCKRLCLMLRWLIREDNVDIGIWHHLDPSELLLPLDVHSLNTLRELGVITRKSNDMKTVIEATNWAKTIYPDDPTILDFFLFGYSYEKSHPQEFEEVKQEESKTTSLDLLLSATYLILWLNDCATNLIKDIEYDIKFKDKETRKIYGALKRRINIYQHEIHSIVGDNKAEFFANFNEAMDDTFMPLINDIKKEILKSYVEHDIDDADYLSMVETARFMTEYSCKVNINCVRDMFKLTDKAVSLRSYRLTELNQIMENFANWSYRNCPFFNLNDQSEVLNKFHILDNAIGEIQNTLNAIEVANKYIGE